MEALEGVALKDGRLPCNNGDDDGDGDGDDDDVDDDDILLKRKSVANLEFRWGVRFAQFWHNVSGLQ